jgi:hypothetical protein
MSFKTILTGLLVYQGKRRIADPPFTLTGTGFGERIILERLEKLGL